MNFELKLATILSGAVLMACAMFLIGVIHSRERDHDEFQVCTRLGGSVPDRRGDPSCVMPDKKELKPRKDPSE